MFCTTATLRRFLFSSGGRFFSLLVSRPNWSFLLHGSADPVTLRTLSRSPFRIDPRSQDVSTIDAQAALLSSFSACSPIPSSSSLLFSTHETTAFFRSSSSLHQQLEHRRAPATPLPIALQIPLVVTAETQAPATRSCCADIGLVPLTTAATTVNVTVIVADVFQAVVVGSCRVHDHDVGDADGRGGGGGGRAIVVDNTSGSPILLYSNARRIAALGLVAESLAALGRRRRRAAILRPRRRRRHPVLHVVGQPRRQ